MWLQKPGFQLFQIVLKLLKRPLVGVTPVTSFYGNTFVVVFMQPSNNLNDVKFDGNHHYLKARHSPDQLL